MLTDLMTHLSAPKSRSPSVDDSHFKCYDEPKRRDYVKHSRFKLGVVDWKECLEFFLDTEKLVWAFLLLYSISLPILAIYTQFKQAAN